MILCTWDTDDFESDVYVREDHGVYSTHVARTRYATPAPKVPSTATIPKENGAARRLAISVFCERVVAQREWMLSTPLVQIGGPYDGKSFIDQCPRQVLDRLHDLMDSGYRVPASVTRRLRYAGGLQEAA